MAEDPPGRERAFRGDETDRGVALPAYDLREREMPEPGRVLEPGDGDFHDWRRDMHTLVPLLQYLDGQAAALGPGRARQRGGEYPPDGVEARGDHLGGPG